MPQQGPRPSSNMPTTTPTPSPPPSSIPGLTPFQLASFRQNGYLVIPNFLSGGEVSSLLQTTHALLDGFPLASHPLTCFTTGDESDDDTSYSTNNAKAKHIGDQYFLTSGNKIHFFFEPDAFIPNSSPPELRKPKALSINKIGHALHVLSPPFAQVTVPSTPAAAGSHNGISTGARNAAIARDLGFRDPRVLQSMVICKQPGIGAAVHPHKDSEFLYTDPPSAVGWWVALQDAGKGNGALGVWRGSHRRGNIQRRLVRCIGGEADGGTEFVKWDGPGLAAELAAEARDGQDHGNGDEEPYEPRDEDFELLEVQAGSLVLIHGNVLHQSERNTSDKSRFAYTFHVIEGAEGWKYDERNWLQPEPGEGFTRLFAKVY
ncbi:phytanoyl-CoA dioxygenase [Histoplasma capsulatum G186AR]|nr:phytanoyl-CoA dioxygenase [Histoplasma capsulatum]QSS72298.1 phytanoyl-CoA dioxygenase [Histoplasma capsulatum G186AR]